MRKFWITVFAARVGKVQHVILADDFQSAQKRVRRAHPNCEILDVVERSA